MINQRRNNSIPIRSSIAIAVKIKMTGGRLVAFYATMASEKSIRSSCRFSASTLGATSALRER
jgi:hypothetical protein